MMASDPKDEERRRGDALVDRLARQSVDLEARRRAENAAVPPPALPGYAARDGKPAPRPPQPEAPGAVPPRRVPLGPPGNPPRTRTPFKSAGRSEEGPHEPPPEAFAPPPQRIQPAAAPPHDPAAGSGLSSGAGAFGAASASSGLAPFADAEDERAPEKVEPEPFALERRRLSVPRAETPPVFPDDEEEQEEETLDLTARVPQTAEARTRPFSAFEWSVAGRYLRARRKDGFISAISWLSLIGIALGVAALIVVMAVMTGFRHEMVNQILGVNAHATIAPQATDQRRPFTNYDAMAARIGAEPGVIQVAPVIHAQVLASNPNSAAKSIAVVRGVRLEDFRRMKAVADPETAEGSLSLFREDQGVAIGSRLAFMLGLRVGDRISLLSPDGDLTPFGERPRVKAYPVTYVFKLGMSELDSALLYMPLEEAQLYFNKDRAADALEVTVQDPQRVDQMEPAFVRAAGEPISIFTWSNSNSSYIGALDMERRVMRLILSLIILIAAFNIISGLIMLVKEKGRDVAILRTIGASRGAIMRIFFLCGAAIGVIGTLLGVALGVTVALNIAEIQAFVENVFGAKVFPDDIYFLSRLPSRLQWGDVASTMLISLGVSFLATIFPARRAARLDPVEALRYE